VKARTGTRGARLVRLCVAHLLTAAALTAGAAISLLPPLRAATVASPAQAAAPQPASLWPAPQAPFDGTPVGPPESAGASRLD